MIKGLKHKMASQFEQMRMADPEVVLHTIKDNRCLALKRSLEEDTLQAMDPEDDIPSGQQIIRLIMQEKKLMRPAIDMIITLFDHMSEALAHLSSTAANISSLAKIVDSDTLKLIMRVSMRPLVQMMIPERFLDPIHATPDINTSRESMMKKVKQDLLLHPNKACLMREPDNGLMRLLCVAVWVKLNRLFFNKGTQKEAATLFCV